MTNFNRQSIPYPASWDYGPRPRSRYPTLAVVFHMAEGLNVAQYLSGGRVGRGVSVHYTIEQGTSRWKNGEVVRCLPENRISGSINPDTLRTTNDKTLFGYKHAKAALGKWWSNPNVAIITVEVAGRNKYGPTAMQMFSMVDLFEDIDSRYSGTVIPLGHRDFQNVKPCPGKTANIRKAYNNMGGHGLDHQEVRYMSTRGYKPAQVCTVADDAPLFNYPGGPKIGDIDPPLTRGFLGWSPNGRDYALISAVLNGKSRTAWTRAGKVSNVRTLGTPVDETAFERGVLVGRISGLDEAEDAVADVER